MKIKKIDMAENIASFTGLNLDTVKLFLDAFKLALLNSVLENQFEEEELDIIDTGIILLDFEDYPKIGAKFSEEMKLKLNETVKGRDFLSEAVVLKFNNDLLQRYLNGGDDALFDMEPAIKEGTLDE